MPPSIISSSLTRTAQRQAKALMPLQRWLDKLFNRDKPSDLNSRQQALYDVLRNARDAAVKEVPPPLRKDFVRHIYTDRVLEASAMHLLNAFRGNRRNSPDEEEPDPWLHNDYVANYLRGMLQLQGFDEQVRRFNGDPNLIAETMAERVSMVAFWTPRNN
ncbi:MAG: hypothetical protein O2812_04680 [Chloroflexi bacterium]|nr:hypothetical protein [Chloroflexota bacterium]